MKDLLVSSSRSTTILLSVALAISIVSAYAVAFFSFPGRMFFFWMIFVTLMLPVEVRIIPTYKVVTDLHLVNTFGGLTVPLIASATATLLFRQVFLTIPDELAEAAKIDGAGAMRFFWQIVLPLSRTNIAALFVILFRGVRLEIGFVPLNARLTLLANPQRLSVVSRHATNLLKPFLVVNEVLRFHLVDELAARLELSLAVIATGLGHDLNLRKLAFISNPI